MVRSTRMPVHWLDWSEEPFRQAREEDKPVLLLLGAAWCPKTRALERDFFSSAAVAEGANRDYVPIRVDADRRPDVAERYNAGGWPTVAFLTPSGAVLWAAASVDSSQVRPVLEQLAPAWRTHKSKLEEEVRKRDEKLDQQRREIYALSSKLGPEVFRKTVRGIVFTVDSRHGGFGREPKYPMVPSLHVLLQAYREAGGADLRDSLAVSLAAIERALFDPVEGGFFRYSEGEDWSSPHTEKTCEDNAAMLRAFLDAWAVFGRTSYRERAIRTVEWALAALWDRKEATVGASVAGDPEYYSSPKRSNSPPVDRTAITTAASMMSSSFLRAAILLGRRELADLAFRCLDGLVRNGVDPSRGAAHYFDPEPRLHGLARSQGLLARALLDAYEAGGRTDYLDRAVERIVFCRDCLWSSAEKGILDRRPGLSEGGALSQPRKSIQENALVAEGAIRIGHLVADGSHLEFARRILSSFPEFLDDYGHYTAEYAIACDWLARPIVAVELGTSDGAWVTAALAPFVPRRVVRHRPGSPTRVFRGGEVVASPKTPAELRAALVDLP